MHFSLNKILQVDINGKILGEYPQFEMWILEMIGHTHISPRENIFRKKECKYLYT